MEMFSNWMFWAVIIVIMSLFALIGYISENNRKKKEKSFSYEKPVLPSKEDINNNVSDPVDENSTLNLDSGTWSANSEEDEVKNVGLDSFESPYSSADEVTKDESSNDSYGSENVEVLEDGNQSDVFSGEDVSTDVNAEVEAPVEDLNVDNTETNEDDGSEVWKM